MPLPHPLTLDDEGRHGDGDGVALWNESWYLDFTTADGTLGGYVRIGVVPTEGAAWLWACVVGEDRPLVTALRHDLALPAARGAIAVGAPGDGAFAEQRVDLAYKRATVAVAADALSYADPAGVYGAGAPGRAAGLELELTWTSAAAPYPYPGMTRYELPCTVDGTIRVDGSELAFDGHGERDHSWGPRDWWQTGWCWTAGRLDDGTWFHGMRPELDTFDYEPGFVVPPGGTLRPAAGVKPTYERGEHGFPTGGDVAIDGIALRMTPLHLAPVHLVAGDGRVARFPRALCRFDDDAGGRRGYGWTEWNQPGEDAT